MRRLLLRLAALLAVVVLAGVGCTGYQAWQSSRPVSLPVLAGPYRVGRSTFDWTDGGRFPVVVLEPGLGFSAPQYSALAESLAARGYYVAGVTPTYSANLTVLGGRVVVASDAGIPQALDEDDLHGPAVVPVADRLTGVWAADARFAADRLAADPRLGAHTDRQHTAYLGHSFGGSAALQACRADPRCAAAVDLDGTQYGSVTRQGLTEPVMIVQSGGSCVTGTCTTADGDVGDARVARQLLNASPGPHRCYTADDAAHFSFTDYGAYHLAWPLRHLLPLGSAPGRRVLTDTAAQVAAFLQGTPVHTSLLDEIPC
jgi:dienelactone hydrolase